MKGLFQLKAVASNSLPYDSSALKDRILSLVHDNKKPLTPLISPLETDKRYRGFNHPQIGQMLCPVEYDYSQER
jgi:hypothetical protein